MKQFVYPSHTEINAITILTFIVSRKAWFINKKQLELKMIISVVKYVRQQAS